MTYVFSASLLPNTGTEAMFAFKNALTNIGWIVVSSSNGTTLSSGDTITTLAALTNSNSYFIIKQPLAATASYGGWQREFGIQRGAANTSWRIDYTVSSSHQFGGTATTMASGADRRWVFESGGYQNGAVATLFITDGTFRFHICTDNAAPYGFYAVSIPVGGGNPNCMVFDPLLSGSFAANEQDPTVEWFQGDSNAFGFNNANSPNNASNQITASNMTPRGWMAKTTVTESYVGLQVPTMGIWNAGGSFIVVNATVALNHADGTDNFHPIYYLKPNNAGGSSSVKGISTLFSGAWNLRASGTALTVATTRDRIVFRSFTAVWGGMLPQI